jgi:HD superfamily phosphohydrolase
MSKLYKTTLFNDPIYGFIPIETRLLFSIISHPYFQRLRRISQMGLSSIVYPGANHTRFEHALGCVFLMQKTISVLSKKGVKISAKESEAMQIAILLHDIGHGPFSHATEKILVKNFSHEQISAEIIIVLNKEFDGALDLAISILNGSCSRKFMHQLISGQIDIDRLDYLKRDSFYTGVTEGNINTERIISTMTVENDNLIFEEKGLYSLEKFLLARRLMYWQVYLHKTSLCAELILTKVIDRFKLLKEKTSLIPKSLLYFLEKPNSTITLNNETIKNYLKIDDNDLFVALKSWCESEDLTLNTLSKMIINRKLLKIELRLEPFKVEEIKIKKDFFRSGNNIISEIENFIFTGHISNQMFSLKDNNPILIKRGNKKILLQEIIKYLDFKQFSSHQIKHYLCYPKDIF